VAEARTTTLQNEIEDILGDRVPEVEVVLAERVSPSLVRVVIDREAGVDVALCELVTRELSAIRDRYGLEVSSPGLDRPLTKPQHFRRVVGSTVDVRTVDPIDGRRHFSGRLLQAGDDELELDQDGAAVRIAYAGIRRSNLVYDPAGGRA
jgi:ribosome maturation factor RimP